MFGTRVAGTLMGGQQGEDRALSLSLWPRTVVEPQGPKGPHMGLHTLSLRLRLCICIRLSAARWCINSVRQLGVSTRCLNSVHQLVLGGASTRCITSFWGAHQLGASTRPLYINSLWPSTRCINSVRQLGASTRLPPHNDSDEGGGAARDMLFSPGTHQVVRHDLDMERRNGKGPRGRLSFFLSFVCESTSCFC